MAKDFEGVLGTETETEEQTPQETAATPEAPETAAETAIEADNDIPTCGECFADEGVASDYLSANKEQLIKKFGLTPDSDPVITGAGHNSVGAFIKISQLVSIEASANQNDLLADLQGPRATTALRSCLVNVDAEKAADIRLGTARPGTCLVQVQTLDASSGHPLARRGNGNAFLGLVQGLETLPVFEGTILAPKGTKDHQIEGTVMVFLEETKRESALAQFHQAVNRIRRHTGAYSAPATPTGGIQVPDWSAIGK